MTDLVPTAEHVLDRNWLGSSTKPSAHLYPHQWSWDSAFIAVGNARRGKVDRAVAELSALFEAQWSTGLVPHMVFDPDATDYFPSPELWGTAAVAAVPEGFATSGMCQPPVHALAVRLVAAQLDTEQRRPFLEDLYEPLRAWHSYLHRARTSGSPLLEIWHPWESGMDNSPAWDEALARLDPDPADIPAYRRVDTDVAAAGERPTTEHYDRYVYLLEQLRRVEYQPGDETVLPFRICDVLFNSIAADADAHLAAISDAIDAGDSRMLRERSTSLTAAIEAEMWSDALGMYADVDRTTGDQIEVPIAGGLLPLLLDLSPEHRRHLVATLLDRFAVPVGGSDGLIVPTVPVGDRSFDGDRYWRGPAWVNIMWLLIRGLRAAGRADVAARLRGGVVHLARSAGCAEYYNPVSGAARGATEFSWTAALLLDLVLE